MARDTGLEKLHREQKAAWKARRAAKRALDDAKAEVKRLLLEHKLQRLDEHLLEHEGCSCRQTVTMFRGVTHGAIRRSAKLRKSILKAMSRRRQGLLNDLACARANHQVAQDVYARTIQEYEIANRRLIDERLHVGRILRIERDNPGLLKLVPTEYAYTRIKVRDRKEGGFHIYFGGVARPDGLMHGHYMINAHGTCFYMREPSMPVVSMV